MKNMKVIPAIIQTKANRKWAENSKIKGHRKKNNIYSKNKINQKNQN